MTSKKGSSDTDDQYLSSEHWNLQNSIRRVSPKGEEHFILCQGHAITLPLYALLLICLERLLQAPDQVCSEWDIDCLGYLRALHIQNFPLIDNRTKNFEGDLCCRKIISFIDERY